MTMLDYIMEQAEIFRKVLEQNVEITAGFGEIFDGEKPDHVYLIASGTSCNAAKAAAPFMEQVLKREVSVFPPSQMERVFGERPLLIFISQGGKSTNMIAAVEKMKGYPRIAMTGNADGRINSMWGRGSGAEDEGIYCDDSHAVSDGAGGGEEDRQCDGRGVPGVSGGS